MHFYGGLATTRLLATDAQIDAQNAPVDSESVAPKMAELLQIDWSVVHTK